MRLWKDESGVVLALTVIVFLTLFMMGLSVYAVGETVRQRVELQNAADAAAYSAAIVQADCNSRVAALNRAMSWCYVQMVKKEMDYIVDKWLMLTLRRWNEDNQAMRQYNLTGSCNWGLPFYATGKNRAHTMILLNKHHLVSKYQIEAARAAAAAQGKSYTALAPEIDECRKMIDQIKAKEKELIRQLPSRITRTVETILRQNIRDTWNDGFAGGAGVHYALKQEEDPLNTNFRVLRQDEEDDFLVHADFNNGAVGTFQEGINDWFVQQYDGVSGPGLQRQYKRNHRILVAEWDWWSSRWQLTKAGCVPAGQISGTGPRRGPVKGDDNEIYTKRYYITALAEPQVLREPFFAKTGRLLVGLTRRLNNPLQFLVAGGELGIIRPFTVDDGKRSMWTVTAGIAGYNPKYRQPADGQYEVTYEKKDYHGQTLWNLKTSDWDAELLPLHRAQAMGRDRNWTGETAGEILGQMKSGPWVPLYGGGGAPGNETAPKLMGGGGSVSYGSAEAWVVH